jgi:glycosyltransferase involved in cell wall biosynthesis
MKKILFITQNLARTGSEMVLWYLLNHLPQQEFKAYVFCINQGELYEKLPKHIEKSASYKNSRSGAKKLFRSLLKISGKDPFEYQLMRIHRRFNPDLWYVNSIALPQVYPVAEKLPVKVVTHFHELLYAFTYLKKSEMEAVITRSDYCIACSTSVLKNIQAMGHQKVSLQYSFIDDTGIHTNPERINELRQDLGLLESDFVWVMSGSVIYMKGLNYLINLLETIKEDPIKIIWIGGSLHSGLDYYVEKTAATRYPGKLIFAGPQSKDYYNYLSLANGFLMLSHEESFSLVLVEAAYLGIPMVSLNTGIAADFIKEGMGKVSKSTNIEDIVSAMLQVQQGRTDTALLKSEASKFTVSRQIGSYLKLLKELA